jgi:charged multivesicular body protein 5
MHRLFGKAKPKEPAPSLGDAATSINNRVSAIDDKIKQLDSELSKFKEQLKKAKGPAAENIKRRAIETLRRKRMYESQRDQMAGQAFNIEQTSFAIETVKDTQTTIFAMKAAQEQLRTEHKKINISEVEDMQDDLEGKSCA